MVQDIFIFLIREIRTEVNYEEMRAVAMNKKRACLPACLICTAFTPKFFVQADSFLKSFLLSFGVHETGIHLGW